MWVKGKVWVKSRTSLCYRLMENSSSRPTWEHNGRCGLAGPGVGEPEGYEREASSLPKQLWRSVWTNMASEKQDRVWISRKDCGGTRERKETV